VKRLRIVGECLGVALACALAGLAAEAVYRLYLNGRYEHMASAAKGSWVVLPDDPRGYALPPSHTGTATFLVDTTKSFGYTTNAAGYRDREWAQNRSGIPRVLVVGDSYAFGWAVAAEEAFPRQLESILTERGRLTEVLNGSVPGYGTVEELEVVRELVPLLSPDLVVLAYVMNDAEPIGTVPLPPKRTYQGCLLWSWEDLKQQVNSRLLPERWELSLCKKVNDFNYLKGFSQNSPKWRRSHAALEAMAGFCRQRATPLLLVVLPDFYFPLDGRYPWPAIHATVDRWGAELRIETVDLLQQFLATHAPYGQFRVEGDGHPNAAAHHRIAELLAPEVERMISARTPAT